MTRPTNALLMLAILLLAAGGAPLLAQEEGAPPAEDIDSLGGEDLDVSKIDQILRGEQEVNQGEVFTYDPAGRRDPFKSLLEGIGDTPEGPTVRPPGLAGMLIEELKLGGIIQTLGLVLGGRFELPADSALMAFGEGSDGPCFEIYVLLTAIPDVPPSFLSLLTMGMAERPAGLRALERWMGAFTPEEAHWPGNFTIISLRTSRSKPPRVSLYLRPIEFDMSRVAEQAA